MAVSSSLHQLNAMSVLSGLCRAGPELYCPAGILPPWHSHRHIMTDRFEVCSFRPPELPSSCAVSVHSFSRVKPGACSAIPEEPQHAQHEASLLLCQIFRIGSNLNPCYSESLSTCTSACLKLSRLSPLQPHVQTNALHVRLRDGYRIIGCAAGQLRLRQHYFPGSRSTDIPALLPLQQLPRVSLRTIHGICWLQQEGL